MNSHLYLFLLLFSVQTIVTADNTVTQTVYGFLDFTTTIGNTVMVFSPQSAPKLELNFAPETPVTVIETKPLNTEENSVNDEIKPSKTSAVKTVISSRVEESVSTSSSSSKSSSPSPPATSPSPSPPSSPPPSPPSSPSPPPPTSPPSPPPPTSPPSSPSPPSPPSPPSSPSPPSRPSPPSPNPKKEIQKKTSVSVKVSSDSEVKVVDNIDKPEYDLLSRQPTEYAEESYRVVNHKSNLPNFKKNRATNIGPRKTQEVLAVSATDRHPVGLVTKFSGSALNDGTTTLYETSVIGTYISGKYAQVLQSSSSIVSDKKGKIRPSSSLRILSTATPVLPKPGAKPANRFNANRNRLKNSVIVSSVTAESYPTTEAYETSTKKSSSRRKSKRRNKHSSRPSSTSQKVKFVTPSPSAEPGGNRKSFRPKIQPSAPLDESSTSVYMFKLNRAPGRWQYKTSPKPRVNIRKSTPVDNPPPSNASLNVTPATGLFDSNLNDQIQNSILEQGDLESSDSQNGAVLNNVDDDKRKFFVETLNVEISTPPGFKDTYYEIATIKTPFIFQAGVVKKTRYITVTSTYEKILTSDPADSVTFEGPLTENILATATQTISPSSIDIGTTTLSPIHLQETEETPALETATETFSLTQTKLKTQILPVINDRENNTSYLTLVQTYDITSLITATRTYSPQDPNFKTKNFKDIGDNLDEAGSEINLELEFGDENNDEPLHEEKHFGGHNEVQPNKAISTAPIQTLQTNDPQKQLDIFNLFNPQPGFTVITTTRPVVKLETLWESHVVPIINGASTSFRTLSKSIGVVDKTEYQIDSSTVALPTVPTALPPVNPFILPQNFQTITNSLVQQTLVTQTNSKILKLTFGARTALTTLYSTAIVPTAMTIYMTTTLPVQPSAAYPGFYPPPYPPFAYVG